MSSSKSKSTAGRTFRRGFTRKILNVNLGLAEEQLAALKQAMALYKSYSDISNGSASSLENQFSGADASANKAGVSIDEGLNKQLEFIRSGGAASPEQEANINNIAEQALARGRSDLNANLDTGLQTLKNDLAPSLGFRASDSPIIDRGGNILKENVRQYGELESNVRSQQSQALLDYPLKSNEASLATLNFQQKLRQQAVANRLALTGLVGQIGQGLSTIYNPVEALDVTSQTGTSGSSTGGSAASIGTISQGIGSILSGAGNAGYGLQ